VSESDVKIAINGAAGRMGRQLLAAVAERPGTVLGAAIDAPGQACIGVDTSVLSGGETTDVLTSDNVSAVMSDFDTIIDFSAPAVTLALLESLRGSNKRIVIGTTGFDADGCLVFVTTGS